ncbi:MAG: hypothetical protein HYY16_01795 [Planctomycetes bacterium]|nr:hypothetical protein [Planctomycetota bacterium]
MSQYTGNLFEKIGRFVPGYTGYAEKETRRDTDRILRGAIVKILSDRRPALDQAIAELIKSSRLDSIDRLSQIKRKLDNAAALVRTAPQGYSGFFDTVQVKTEDLDRLYRFDLDLREKATQVAGLIDGLKAAKDPAGAGGAVVSALGELEELVRQRDHIIAEMR